MVQRTQVYLVCAWYFLDRKWEERPCLLVGHELVPQYHHAFDSTLLGDRYTHSVAEHLNAKD